MNQELISGMKYRGWVEYCKNRNQQEELVLTVDGKEHLNENVITPEDRRKMYVLTDLTHNSSAKSMNPFSPQGEKVIYTGDEGTAYGNRVKEGPVPFEIGRIYTVKTCIAFEMYNFLELEELPGVVSKGLVFHRANPKLSIEELILLYGPSFEADMEEMDRFNQEWLKNQPKTPLEHLRVIYNRTKQDVMLGWEILDLVEEYFEGDNNRPTLQLGHIFDDGYRSIAVKAISDESDVDGKLNYFCKHTEHGTGYVWYNAYHQDAMEVIRLVDVNLTCDEFDEITKILKDLNELNHGIVNADIYVRTPKFDQVKAETAPKYTVGQCYEDHGNTTYVIAISDGPDMYGDWVYFLKTRWEEANGESWISYYIEP